MSDDNSPEDDESVSGSPTGGENEDSDGKPGDFEDEETPHTDSHEQEEGFSDDSGDFEPERQDADEDEGWGKSTDESEKGEIKPSTGHRGRPGIASGGRRDTEIGEPDEPIDDGPDESIDDGPAEPIDGEPDESIDDGPDEPIDDGPAEFTDMQDRPEIEPPGSMEKEPGAVEGGPPDESKKGEPPEEHGLDRPESDRPQVEDGVTTEGAPDDEELPLADHIQEMVHRLGVVVVLMAGVSAVVFPFAEQIINFIWYSFLPGTFDQCPTTAEITTAAGETFKPACPRVYHPLGTIIARFKVSTLAGFVVALPAFVYETYLFMRPGLYPRERRYYLAAVPTSLVLAAVGVVFAYLLVLPAIFTYFLYYSEGAAEIAFSLTETFDLMVLMIGFFAVIFQIPLFIMLAIMMGVTTRQWLVNRRLLFWAAFGGIAFIFNPDPTGMAPFIIAGTMIVLFEGTLLLLSWTSSKGLLPVPDEVASRRPHVWAMAIALGYLISNGPLPTSFYDELPGFVQNYLASNDLLGVTPIVIGGALIVVYEAILYQLRQLSDKNTIKRTLLDGKIRLQRLRAPVWVISLLIGYFASPDPFLLYYAQTIQLGASQAVALAGGLIIAFEVGLVIWRALRPDDQQRLPIKHE